MKFTTRMLQYYQEISCCVVNFPASKFFSVRLVGACPEGEGSGGWLVDDPFHLQPRNVPCTMREKVTLLTKYSSIAHNESIN